MATINGTTNNNQWTYKLEVFEDNYSIENNTSNVTVKVYLGRASSRSYVGGNWTGTVTVNGVTRNVSGTIPYPTYIDGGAWYEIKSETFTSILHNDDGSKTIGVSATMSSTVFTPSSCSASGNVTLTTIPRASSISCSGGNIGSATTISISRASSSFTHTLIYSFGSLTNRTIVTKTSSASVSWSIPTSFYAQIPNSNSGIITLTCQTYNGNTLIGTKTTTCTAKVTNSNPTFTASQLTYLDSNSSVVAITENNQHIVRNQSNLKVSYTAASGKNSATISSYVITFNGGTQTKTAAATIDYGTVNLSSNTTVSVKAIDSRGNSTTISKTVQIKDWVLPSATITAGRVNNYEDETHLKANVTISSVNSKNAIQSIQYRYKKSSDANYGSYVSMSNNVQSTLSIGKLYAWDFQIVITDKFGSTTYSFTIAKGMPIMFFDVNKLSVGVNSFPKVDNTLDVGSNLIVEDIKCRNMLTITETSSTARGITMSVSNGEITTTGTFSGTETTFVFGAQASLKGGTTYTLSTNNSAGALYPYLLLYDKDNNQIARLATREGILTFTPSSDVEVNKIGLYINSSSGIGITIKPQLEEGTSKTDFVVGKNYGFTRGNNDNGSYIKYDDGTMIQWGYIYTGTTAFTTAYGNCYYDNQSHRITFSQSFIDDNFSTCLTPHMRGGIGGACIKSENPSAIDIYVFSMLSYTFSREPYVCWQAIGRWK